MEPVKITNLRLENVKRVRAVELSPTENGLTVIGGKNGQGKTSVLDAIAWALGGDKYKPSTPNREGSVLPPELEIRLSNGLLVQRKGKSSALTVTDETGRRAGQTLLNEFVSTFAIDLPKFLDATDKEKADTLLKIIGVGDELRMLEGKEQLTYNERRYVGQEADRKRKFADEMPWYDGMPEAPVSAGELIQRQQAILLRNAENQKLRGQVEQLNLQKAGLLRQYNSLVEELKRTEEHLNNVTEQFDRAFNAAANLTDESTEELEADIQRVDDINRQVRANLDKQKADEDARIHKAKYDALTDQLEQIREAKKDLLSGAKLPLPGLTVENGVLLYDGKAWDCMSGSEKLIVGASIAAAIKPECGFILLDKLEQMDSETLDQFGAWLREKGLQAIATRVSTGEECTIVIEDGEVEKVSSEYFTRKLVKVSNESAFKAAEWKPGEF